MAVMIAVVSMAMKRKSYERLAAHGFVGSR
jgi:hypothetical protein